jgi:trk system potassium uptake protein TrkH
MMLRNRILKAHPAMLILTSFLLVIAVGTALLLLPVSTQGGTISLVNAVFTASSAVCVTGLVVLDTGTYFTMFGQCVILGLIQIGGLGLMTISVALFRWIGRGISFRQRMIMQDLFAHTPRQDILNLVISVVLFTFGAEIMGAVLLSMHWSKEFPFFHSVYMAVFHSVSAFCNAGFSLFPDNMARYSQDILLNTTMCGLIIVGGIGFPVLFELRSRLRRHDRERVRLSIQTKSVLLTTLILVLGGALMFAFLEHETLWRSPSLSHRILVPLFKSITCRTAGFNTVDIGSLRDATLALMIFLMFVGASPGSCGGGVKTTTLALMAAFTFSRVKRRRRVNMFKKSIPVETVTRSVSLLLVSIGFIAVVLFMLLIGETASARAASGPGGSFLAFLFETVSAFGTVGLSMGVTPELGTWGKCWITLMMIVGRVGVLTFSYIIVGTGAGNGVEYSEENLMIG